jgi:DNA replication protein DnaC
MDRFPEPPGSDPLARGLPPQLRDCDRHGPFLAAHVMGRVYAQCPHCADERAEIERVEAQRRDDERRAERLRSMLNGAAIPMRFRGRGFENFVAATDAQRHALTVSRSFAEDFDAAARAGRGLIFSGMPGTGKSHLAAAILQAVMAGRDVFYVTCLDLIRTVRETWRKDAERSERQVLRELERLDLLVIDEMGVQYGTDGEQTILFDVLDRRYREVRPTILLTNQDKAGLRAYVGDRIFDRLAETCNWVPFDWPSYRPMARREAAA